MRFEDQFEPNSNLRAWLHRIMVSVFITRCRRQRRERRALENLTHDPCAWTLPEKAADAQTLSPSVERALFSLPVAFRQAVELVDIAEMSYRDAATIIGVPLGTVMSRLHRGRKLLADALRDTNGTAPVVTPRGPGGSGSRSRPRLPWSRPLRSLRQRSVGPVRKCPDPSLAFDSRENVQRLSASQGASFTPAK